MRAIRPRKNGGRRHQPGPALRSAHDGVPAGQRHAMEVGQGGERDAEAHCDRRDTPMQFVEIILRRDEQVWPLLHVVPKPQLPARCGSRKLEHESRLAVPSVPSDHRYSPVGNQVRNHPAAQRDRLVGELGDRYDRQDSRARINVGARRPVRPSQRGRASLVVSSPGDKARTDHHGLFSGWELVHAASPPDRVIDVLSFVRPDVEHLAARSLPARRDRLRGPGVRLIVLA